MLIFRVQLEYEYRETYSGTKQFKSEQYRRPHLEVYIITCYLRSPIHICVLALEITPINWLIQK